MFNAINAVLTLLILIALGYFLRDKDWFSQKGLDFLSKFTLQVSIPAYMVINVTSTFKDASALFAILSNIFIPIFCMLISLIAGLIMSRFLKIGKGRQGIFINAMTFSNTVIIGFPVASSIFGDIATPYAMVYYMSNTVLFWTIGTYLIKKEASDNVSFLTISNLKRMMSPPLVGFLVGMAIVLSPFSLPQFIFDPLNKVALTTSPLSMIFIGGIIRGVDFKQIKLTKDLVAIVISRFILSPLLIGLICWMLPIDPLMKKVFFIMSTMPAMTQLGIVAKEYNSDYEFASVVTTLTTSICMVALPFYAVLLEVLPFFK